MAQDKTPPVPTEDTMGKFNEWFTAAADYVQAVGIEVAAHPNPDEYYRQMDELIAAKENTP